MDYCFDNPFDDDYDYIIDNNNSNGEYNNKVNKEYNNKVNEEYNNKVNKEYNNKVNEEYNNKVNEDYNNKINDTLLYDKETLLLSSSLKVIENDAIKDESIRIKAKERFNNIINNNKYNNNMTTLWADKYSPKRYTDLITDEKLNRTVLEWLYKWKDNIINNEKKGRRGGDDSINNTIQNDDKVLLIGGRSGIGKSSLIRICAEQAGFKIIHYNYNNNNGVDYNNEVKKVIEDVTKTNGITTNGNNNNKPHLLLFDNITSCYSDSLSNNIIDNIVSILSYKEGGMVKSEKCKYGMITNIKRPIVCICDDIWNRDIRKLRVLSKSINIPSIDKSKLKNRLNYIFKKEVNNLTLSKELLEFNNNNKIIIENNGLSKIIDISECDIRLSINHLQIITRIKIREIMEMIMMGSLLKNSGTDNNNDDNNNNKINYITINDIKNSITAMDNNSNSSISLKDGNYGGNIKYIENEVLNCIFNDNNNKDDIILTKYKELQKDYQFMDLLNNYLLSIPLYDTNINKLTDILDKISLSIKISQSSITIPTILYIKHYYKNNKNNISSSSLNYELQYNNINKTKHDIITKLTDIPIRESKNILTDIKHNITTAADGGRMMISSYSSFHTILLPLIYHTMTPIIKPIIINNNELLSQLTKRFLYFGIKYSLHEEYENISSNRTTTTTTKAAKEGSSSSSSPSSCCYVMDPDISSLVYSQNTLSSLGLRNKRIINYDDSIIHYINNAVEKSSSRRYNRNNKPSVTLKTSNIVKGRKRKSYILQENNDNNNGGGICIGKRNRIEADDDVDDENDNRNKLLIVNDPHRLRRQSNKRTRIDIREWLGVREYENINNIKSSSSVEVIVDINNGGGGGGAMNKAFEFNFNEGHTNAVKTMVYINDLLFYNNNNFKMHE